MARTRLAVALMVPEPWRTEVDGLRRAVGGNLERIAPHITLVPPVNVRDEHLGEAWATVRGAATALPGPLRLRIGPAASFAPANRVLYLAVGGPAEELSWLGELRRRALDGVLAREDHRRFVPHVTLTNRLTATDESDAIRLFAGYEVEVEMGRIDLLGYDTEARRWSTIADAPLGPRWVVGRGGLELELTPGSVLDPEAALWWSTLPGEPDLPPPVAAPEARVVVMARREGRVAGAGVARVHGGWASLEALVVDPAARRTGVGGHLEAALRLELERRGVAAVVADVADRPAFRHLLTGRGWAPSGRDATTLTATLKV